MKVVYINNDGSGFADTIDVPEGSTIGELFAKRMAGRNAADFMIRHNRQPCTASEVLQEGSRISITPTKIEGA